MKKLLLSIIFFSITILFAQTPQWLRYPSISPDGHTIAFSYQSNIYTVNSSGGQAKPLVINDSHDYMPVWSKDGKHLAFASNRHGNFDIFIIPSSGGEPARLTYNSVDEFPYSFSPDNQFVIFGAARLDAPSNRQFPSESLQELYKVPFSGGRVSQILTTPAEDAKISNDGRFIIYHDRKGRENPWRKHQISSIARDIWIYDSKLSEHTKLTSFEGEDRSPVFSSDGKEVFYLSEKDGDFNVFKMNLNDSASSQQQTFFKNNPVRFLSIAVNNTLCFGYDGQIYTKKENKKPFKLIIKIPETVRQPTEKEIPVDKAKQMAVSPNGKEVAFIFRGEVFVSNVEKKEVKQITNTPQSETGVSFSPDGTKLLYASERNNRWEIYEAKMKNKDDSLFSQSSGIIEVPLIANDKENYQPLYSSDGSEIAYIENRNVLRIYNIVSKKSRTILKENQLLSRREGDQYFQWSPDGEWLLVQYNEQGAGNSEVGIVSVSGEGQLINLTKNGYSDETPKWMMNGKMIMWSSDRLGLKNENSNTTQNDIFGLFPDERAWQNFKMKATNDESQKNTDSSKNILNKNEILFRDSDWKNTSSRIIKLTNRSSFVMDALVSKEGKDLYFLDKFEKNYDLWHNDLRTKETKKILPLNVRDAEMQWDNEERNIFLLADGNILRINITNLKIDTISIKTELKMDVSKERSAMFDHIWRRTAQTFYTEGMHGAKWNEIKATYQRYLKGINNNFDFIEMLNELLGELNVSHTGAVFQENKKDKDVTASLGVFYDEEYKGIGVRIKEIMKEGPLDNSLFGIKPGDIIESVDGEMIEKEKDIDQYLNQKANKIINIKITDGIHSKEIKVKPVSPEAQDDLLYKRWVKRNEEETERLSNGEIGYVHLYRMNDGAYRTTYADVMGKYSKCKAIIVDTRFNRGGDLAPELVMFLSGKKVRVNTTDNFLRSNEPSFRWTKPSIVLANEANYSDGHCFAYDYQYFQMGKLVGMPIPGSCTWMAGQTLQDNSIYYSVPTMGVKTLSGRYMENYQTEPDIKIMNGYGDVSRGVDKQLETAIKELKEDINQHYSNNE